MAYGQLANLYDLFMQHAPYDEWVEITEKIFQMSDEPINRVVDLGCGTGEITIRLAEKGYSMTGIDYSETMLTCASYKANEKNITVDWLKQDIRDLQGLEDFDAAISFCDVMNYITDPEELFHSFQHVYNSLKKGGIFIFDVHHLPYISENYIGNTFAEVTDDVSYIWFCSAGDEPGEMYHDLTFFYLNDGKYDRFDEQHHQRTYPLDFYKKLLHDSGFDNIKIYADFNTKTENVEEDAARIFFSAVKNREN